MSELSQTYEIFIEENTRWEFTLFGLDMNPGDTRFREILEDQIFKYFSPSQKCRPSACFVKNGLDGAMFYDYQVGDHHQGRLSVRAI